MPQLKLYKRRWRVASDTMPLLAGFLAIFHIAFVVPLLILTGTTESTEYECNEKFAVRFTLFSILALYAVSFFNEVAVVFFGLKGGPMEEKRRRVVKPLLHLEVILWLFILGMTCFATYIGESSKVGESCWSSNPCEFSQDVIPAACTVNKTGDVTLSQSCYDIWNTPDKFQKCFTKWADYAATAFVDYYEYSIPNPKYESDPINEYALKPIFSPVNTSTYECADNIKISSKQFTNFVIEAFGPGSIQTDEELEAWQKQQENVALEYELFLLTALNVTHTNTTAGSDAPWFKCFTPECQQWIIDGDECTEWRTMINIPSANSRKKAYLATVYASWGVLLVQALVVFIAFNAWQNYESKESWENTTRGFGRFLGCGRNLEAAETEGGTSAAQEIGSLLHMLFGGIDLDPTDQFLGMYLVSERQRLRRHSHVLDMLKEMGIEPAPLRSTSRWKACCTAVFRSPANQISDWFHKRDDVDLVATLEGPDAITTMGSGSLEEEGEEQFPISNFSNGNGTTHSGIAHSTSDSTDDNIHSTEAVPSNGVSTTNGTLYTTSPAATKTAAAPFEIDKTPSSAAAAAAAAPRQPRVNFAVLPPSPFDTIVENTEQDANNNSTLAISKSTKNKRTSSTSTSSSAFSPRSHGRSLAYTPPAIAHSFVRLVSLKPTNSIALSRASTTAISITKSALEKKLVVEEQSRPLMTPVTLHCLATRLPVTSYEAAVLYGLGQKPPVDKAVLQKAFDLSNFAKAAYGLQTVRWAYASETAGCGPSTYDSLLSCACCAPCRKPLKFSSHFKARNFKSILDLTGIEPSDLLYVSYTCAAFGVLPYMVVLHRPTRSVVVSIRGTVGFDDLITDLLSNPVDASEVLPEWVKNEAGAGAPMYVHAGILSSTKAVMKDLKEKGLLAAMMKTASSGVDANGADGNSSDERFPPAAAVEKSTEKSTTAATGSFNRSQTAAFVRQGSKIADKSASNNKILHKLRTLGDDDSMDLDLERAQTVVDEALNNQGWSVVVTGHSLGAAVACMASFELRQYFPTLQCYAFCPPGGLMSPNLAEVAKQFCTSVVVGCDAITRVSFPNTQRVVDDMVLALARCKRPKLAILMDAMFGRRKNPATTPPTFCTFEDIGSEAQEALKKYVASSKLHSKDADKRELFPPGKIMHLRPFAAAGEQGKKVKNDVWDAVWVSGEEIMSEGVILTFNMLRHHRMPTLQAALGSAMRDEAEKTRRPDFMLESRRGSLDTNGTLSGGFGVPVEMDAV